MANQRGRPPKVFSGHLVGAKPKALLVFNRLRRKGLKHEHAVEGAVAAVNAKYPEFPFRNRDMRKLLAEAQPRDFGKRLMVTETKSDKLTPEDLEELKRSGLDPTKKWTKITVKIAPAIKHRRNNAKGPKKKRIY